MKKTILFLLTSACYMSSFAQNPTTNNSDTCVAPPQYYIGALSNNTDNSVFTAMQNIWYANEKISYLCVPKFYNLINPVIPLREGEGKSGNYLFEANLFNQTPIAMGRNHSNHFWQTSRITFDFGFNVRMALDSSSPLIPNNNVIGLTLNKGLWDSKTKKWGFNGSKKHSFSDWVNKGESLHNLSLNITAHHYSNGQQPGFFLYDTINGVAQKRNDYRKGDFSTNYIQIGLTYSYLTPKRNMFSVKVAYQRDGNFVGPLSFSDEQFYSYGQNRINGFIQYRLVWYKPNKDLTDVQMMCDSCSKKVKIRINKAHELTTRIEYEWILGNLSDYPHSNQYVFNPHLFVQYTRPSWRALGFLVHTYYGRDYSNVRYDLPIFTIMGGISISFHKYRPMFSKKQTYTDSL